MCVSVCVVVGVIQVFLTSWGQIVRTAYKHIKLLFFKLLKFILCVLP